MMMPALVAGAVIVAQPLPLMVTGPVVAIAPYLPGSSAVMMPLGKVAAYACAKVAHGCEMAHALVSAPPDETKVLVAACAGALTTMAMADSSAKPNRCDFMTISCELKRARYCGVTGVSAVPPTALLLPFA